MAVGFIAPQPHIMIQSGLARRISSQIDFWSVIEPVGTG